jgi:hypothetical protein
LALVVAASFEQCIDLSLLCREPLVIIHESTDRLVLQHA